MDTNSNNSSCHDGDPDTRQPSQTRKRRKPADIHEPPDNIDAYDPSATGPADDPFGHPYAATGTNLLGTDNNDSKFAADHLDPHTYSNSEFAYLLQDMSIPQFPQAFPDDSVHMRPYVDDPDVEAFVRDMEHGLDAIEAVNDAQAAGNHDYLPARYPSFRNDDPCSELAHNVQTGCAINPSCDVMQATANEQDFPYDWSADIEFDEPFPLHDALISPLDTNGPLLITTYKGANPSYEEEELNLGVPLDPPQRPCALEGYRGKNSFEHPRQEARQGFDVQEAGQGFDVPSSDKSEDGGIPLEILLKIDEFDAYEHLLHCQNNAGEEEAQVATPFSWPSHLADEAILPDSASSPTPPASTQLIQALNGHDHPQSHKVSPQVSLPMGMEAPCPPAPRPFMANPPPHMASSRRPPPQVAPSLPFRPPPPPPRMAALPQMASSRRPPPQVAPSLSFSPPPPPPRMAAPPQMTFPHLRPPQVAPRILPLAPPLQRMAASPKMAPPRSQPPRVAPPPLPLAPPLPLMADPPHLAPPHPPPTRRRRGRPPIGGDIVDESQPPPNLRRLRSQQAKSFDKES